MKKTLRFNKKPPIISYQYHAYYLGVLFENESFIDYFLCNYINICYNRKNPAHGVDFVREIWYPDMACFTNNAFIYQNELALFNYSSESFIDLVTYMIDHDFYMHGLINAYYLPYHPSYQTSSFGYYDFLIYGYDKDLKIFNTTGYSNGIYKEVSISFSDFYNGIYSLTERNRVNFVKIRDNFVFKFDLANLKRHLNDYLNSYNTFNQGDDDWIFGIKVYEAIKKDIQNNPDKIAIRYLRILLEHKQCMYQRIEYLFAKEYLNDKNILIKYSEVLDNFMIIFNLAIKNYTKFSNEVPNRIISFISSSMEKEQKIIQEVFNSL